MSQALETLMMNNTAEIKKQVNKIQNKKPRSKWKKRSTIKTKAGLAHLFEDETITKAGGIKIFQAILVKNNSAYIQSWLKALKEDRSLIIKASSQAEKAVKYILNENTKPEEN